VAGLDVEALRSGVAAAVDVFLADVELGPGDEVLAATARTLATKLDAVAASETASAAAAIPRLSSELVGVLDRLRAPAVRRPDSSTSYSSVAWRDGWPRRPDEVTADRRLWLILSGFPTGGGRPVGAPRRPRCAVPGVVGPIAPGHAGYLFAATPVTRAGTS